MAEVQIGRGKSARRAYELDDVTIVPSRRTRNADDVDLGWKIDAYRFRLPLVAAGVNAPMSAVDATAAGDAGALAVVNLVLFVADHGTDGLTDALTTARGDNRIAVSVSPKNAAELVPHAVKAEAEMIIIRGDVVSADHVSSGGETLDLKSFIRGLDTPVIVGACQSYEAALHLMRAGAAGVLVGHHGDDLGIAVPLATAIADVRAARVRHLDETSVYCHIIATGPIGDGTDVAKAIAIGADAVVVDQSLVTGDDPAGDALRETMAVCGYTDVKAFQKAEVVVR